MSVRISNLAATMWLGVRYAPFLILFADSCLCFAADSNTPSIRRPPLMWPVTNRYELRLDLTNPTNYSGIPSTVRWFSRSDSQDWCSLQGRVATTIALPDGKSISETFYLVYIDRDEDGIYQVRAESVDPLNISNAISRLETELQEWSTGAWPPQQRAERKTEILNWLTNATPDREMYEGFRTQRSGYELTFSFLAVHPHPAEPRYLYELRLRESKPDAKSECFKNLRIIEREKARWADAHRNSTNNTPALEDLAATAPWIRQFRCPKGGSYKPGKLGEQPTCSIPSHHL